MTRAPEDTTKRGCGGSYEIGSGGHVPKTPGENCPACDRDYGDADQKEHAERWYAAGAQAMRYRSQTPRFARRAD